MAADHRKMLFPYQPGKNVSFTFFIPCFQTYPPPPPLEREISVLVSTSICIMGSVLLFLFLTVFLYLYITQLRGSSAAAAVPPGATNRREDENEAGERDISNDHHVWQITTVGLQRSAIDSITVVRFKEREGIVDGTDCSVCLNEFEENESLRLLPKCSHAFHINCIDTWLLSHKNCPLCRSPVFPTKPRHKKTETNLQSESVSSNEDLIGVEESLGSRNANVLPRSQSDLTTHCGSGGLETVRRSFSIGGSSSVKAGDSDEIDTRSIRHFYSSFSANFFSSSRRLRNQDPVLPNGMPSVSG